MAQTGYTPILIYSSSTTTNAPAVGNLTNSTLGSELAINITDGKLFYKDNANAIQVIGWKTTPTTAGGTGLTSYTAGDLLYYATGTTLSKLAIGASTTVLTSSGSAPQWTAQSSLAVGTASNLKSNATTGVMQIVGPAAAATRVMTIPDANFTAARTDSGQTFTGAQNIENGSGANQRLLYLKQANDYGYAFNIDSNTTGKLFLKAVNAGVESNFLTFDRSTYDFTVNTGNIIQGTAAKGINFTANTPAAGMTSQLLNWYEEGTWTPVDASGAGLSFTGASAYYTRIGRTVTVVFTLVYPTTANASAARIGGLPFTSANTNNGFNNGTFNTNNSGQNIQPSIVANATNFAALLVATGTSATNVQLTGATLRGGLTYFV